MKKQHKWFFAVAAGLTLTSVVSTSCVDDIKFGSAFLEKAPGGDVTSDTVFNSPEYVRQFLNTLYTFQYYGLPFRNSSSDAYPCESSNPYVGKPEALTDCYIYTYLSGLFEKPRMASCSLWLFNHRKHRPCAWNGRI